MKEIQPEINISAECPGYDEDRQKWVGGLNEVNSRLYQRSSNALIWGDLATGHFSEEIGRANSVSSETAHFMDPSDQSEGFLELF